MSRIESSLPGTVVQGQDSHTIAFQTAPPCAGRERRDRSTWMGAVVCHCPIIYFLVPFQVLEGALAAVKAKLEGSEEQVASLEEQVAALEAQLADREQQPTPSAGEGLAEGGEGVSDETAELRARIAALEGKLAARGDAEEGGQEVSPLKLEAD